MAKPKPTPPPVTAAEKKAMAAKMKKSAVAKK